MMALEAISGSYAGYSVREPAQPVAAALGETEAVKKPPAEKGVNPTKQYFSPVMEYDGDAGKLVVLFRDPETGEVTDQIPKKQALERYAEARRLQAREAYEEFLTAGRAKAEAEDLAGAAPANDLGHPVAVASGAGSDPTDEAGATTSDTDTPTGPGSAAVGAGNPGVPLRLVV